MTPTYCGSSVGRTEAVMPVCREDSITRHSVPTALETSTLSRCPGCTFPLENVISSKGMIFKKENLTGDMKDRWEISVTHHQGERIRHRDDGSKPLSLSFPPFRPKPIKRVNLESGRLQKRLTSKMKQSTISTISSLPLPIFCI